MPKIHYTRFPVDGEVANLLPACWQQVVVTEFGKRHDTTDRADFCPRQLVIYRRVANLLREVANCIFFVTDLLRGNWCKGF